MSVGFCVFSGASEPHRRSSVVFTMSGGWERENRAVGDAHWAGLSSSEFFMPLGGMLYFTWEKEARKNERKNVLIGIDYQNRSYTYGSAIQETVKGLL